MDTFVYNLSLFSFRFQIIALSISDRTVIVSQNCKSRLTFFSERTIRVDLCTVREFRCTRTVPVRVKCEASGSLKVKAAEELRAATETHQFRRIQYSSSANTNTETRQSNELNAVQGLGSIPRAEVAFTGYATNVCVVLFDFYLYCTRLW